MITLALLFQLLHGWHPDDRESARAAEAKRQAIDDYEACLADYDITTDENDGECEEP